MWRGGRVLIVVAHPDDETLGFGAEMLHWPDCVILHTTDGSPTNLSDAQHAGFSSQAAYAAARQEELKCALHEVGGRETRSLGFVDGQSWYDLAGLTRALLAVIEEVRPAAILSHPYEGGHPDHDAAAFAVQHACARLSSLALVRIEGAFYNRLGDRFRPGEFLPGIPATDLHLVEETRRRKDRMFACFRSQQRVLDSFSTEWERYRNAPTYDFDQPPHPGVLNYETFGWGITAAQWLRCAKLAAATLTI